VTNGDVEAITPSVSPDSPTQIAGKPELLPWRSRLKGCRVGARIFQGKEAASPATAEAPAKATSPVPHGEPGQASAADSERATESTSAEPRPEQAGPNLEANRPDIVIE
jgi:hypothetical protein